MTTATLYELITKTKNIKNSIKTVLENNGSNMAGVAFEDYPQTIHQAISSSSGGGGLSVTIISPTVNEDATQPTTFEWLVGVEEGIEVISYLFVNDALVYVGTERSFTILTPLNPENNECYVFVIRADNSTAGVSNKITFTTAVFPFSITMDISSANVISYPADSSNYEFTPLNSITAPNQLNEFENFINYTFIPMMFDGITEKPLKRDDYSLLADGLTPSDISNASLNYDAVVKINPIYVNATVDSETKLITSISFSSHSLNETLDAPGFYNSSGEIVPVYLGIYKNSMINGIMRSLSNKPVYTNSILSNHRNAISAKGNNWHMCSFNLRMTLNILCLLLAKNKNLLTTLGAGISPTLGLTTGSTDALGMFWGSTSKSDPLKVLGIENLWGNRSEFIDGLYRADSNYYIKKKPPFEVASVTPDSVKGRFYSTSAGYLGRLTFENGAFFFLDAQARYENSYFSQLHTLPNYTGRLSMAAHNGIGSSETATGPFSLLSEDSNMTSRLLYIPE